MSAEMFTTFVLRSADQIQNIYFTVCLIAAFAGYTGHSVYLSTFSNKACKMNGKWERVKKGHSEGKTALVRYSHMDVWMHSLNT